MAKHIKHRGSKNQQVEQSNSSNSNDSKKLILVSVVVLIIGLLLGAFLVFGYFAITGNNEKISDSNSSVDLVLLKSNVENYVNKNLILDSSLSAKVTDVNDLGNSLFELEYEIYQSDQVVGAGLFYMSGNNLILPQLPVLDITKPLEIPETESQEQEQPQEVSELSAEEIEALGSFMNCLADKNVVIYGANWCGYKHWL